MYIQFRLFLKKIKKGLFKILAIIFTPLVKYVLVPIFSYLEKKSDEKREKNTQYAKNISDEEVGQRLAKVIMKKMLKYDRYKIEVPIVTKFRDAYDRIDNYSGTMIERVKNFNDSKLDKILSRLRYTRKYDFDVWDVDEEIRIEKKKEAQLKQLFHESEIRYAFINECKRLGMIIEYKDYKINEEYEKYSADAEVKNFLEVKLDK